MASCPDLLDFISHPLVVLFLVSVGVIVAILLLLCGFATWFLHKYDYKKLQEDHIELLKDHKTLAIEHNQNLKDHSQTLQSYYEALKSNKEYRELATTIIQQLKEQLQSERSKEIQQPDADAGLTEVVTN